MIPSTKFFRNFVPTLALVTAVAMPFPSAAAEKASLQCVLKGESDQATTLVAGQAPTFSCLVKGDPAPALLLGKQRLGQALPATSATNLDLRGEFVEVSLSFPAVYQPGDYLYTFSLINTTTKETLVENVTVIATLPGAAQPSIKEVAINQNSHEWGAPVSLDLTLTVPKDFDLAAANLKTTVDLQDKAGASCASLIQSQSVTQETGTLSVTLPKQAGNCVNALTVSLVDKDGKMIDQKVVAIGLPTPEATVMPTGEQNSQASAESLFTSRRGLAVLAIVPILLIISLFLLSKRRTLE